MHFSLVMIEFSFNVLIKLLMNFENVFLFTRVSYLISLFNHYEIGMPNPS